MITVTRSRTTPTARNAYGDRPTGTTTTEDLQVHGIAPVSSTEPRLKGRQGKAIDATLYAPFGTDIIATDRIAYGDDTYEVDGETEQWRSGFSGEGEGIVVGLRKAVG